MSNSQTTTKASAGQNGARKWSYSVCPVCGGPNEHVEDGKLKEHHTFATNLPSICDGSGLKAFERRGVLLDRCTGKYRAILAKAKGAAANCF